MNPNDSMELLKKAKQGDNKAKDELVSLNLGLVWSIVKGLITGVMNRKICFKLVV
ncbi:hypothetical protein [Biomaibacter acetigenes]|uniref:hypothetical protein n=1 Tax=Biomaibacter acetigenes TaxID=2316383 RepID=UPI001CA3BCA8|nr:hypothetical protein [Biomaibacter acetigenes]